MRPAILPDGYNASAQSGDYCDWVDEFICARKPTIYLLREFHLIIDEIYSGPLDETYLTNVTNGHTCADALARTAVAATENTGIDQAVQWIVDERTRQTDIGTPFDPTDLNPSKPHNQLGVLIHAVVHFQAKSVLQTKCVALENTKTNAQSEHNARFRDPKPNDLLWFMRNITIGRQDPDHPAWASGGQEHGPHPGRGAPPAFTSHACPKCKKKCRWYM